MSEHHIEAKNISYSYPDGTKALDKVSFRISPGETVALVGANGAGKSTLLQHLNGTLLAKEGAVSICGMNVEKRNLKNIRQKVGMLFQNADDQLFMPTVEEDVAFGPVNLGLEKNLIEKRVTEALTKTGALHLKSRVPYKLSAGEKKLVAISAVLSVEPEILVMDEPAAGLDPASRRSLISLLDSLSYTKIIATHDLDMALELCSRAIVINRGVIKADGLPSEIFSNEQLLEQSRLERPLSLQNCPVCGHVKRNSI